MNEGPPGSRNSMCKGMEARKRRSGSVCRNQGIMTNTWHACGELIVIKLESEAKALQSRS